MRRPFIYSVEVFQWRNLVVAHWQPSFVLSNTRKSRKRTLSFKALCHTIKKEKKKERLSLCHTPFICFIYIKREAPCHTQYARRETALQWPPLALIVGWMNSLSSTFYDVHPWLWMELTSSLHWIIVFGRCPKKNEIKKHCPLQTRGSHLEMDEKATFIWLVWKQWWEFWLTVKHGSVC